MFTIFFTQMALFVTQHSLEAGASYPENEAVLPAWLAPPSDRESEEVGTGWEEGAVCCLAASSTVDEIEHPPEEEPKIDIAEVT